MCSLGDVNPCAKLPITFPRSDADLPHTSIVKPPDPSTTKDGEGGAWEENWQQACPA